MYVTDRATLAFLAVNDAAVAHYGYSRGEFLGMTIKDIRPAEDVPRFLECFSRPGRGNGPVGVWRHCKKNGAVIEVEISSHELLFAGRPARLALAHDITERRRVEAARERLIAILEATPDLVAISQVEGPASYINPAGRQLLGLAPDEEVVLSQFRPDWARKVLLEEAIPTALRERTWSGETVLLNRAGEEIPVSQVLIAHRSPSGGGVEFLATIARDIRGQKQLEERLRQGQKMEAIGRLAGGVAHDFNNLLTVIIGHSGLLLDGHAPPELARGSLEEIHKAADRAAALTRQLLAFSRRAIVRPVILNLNAVVADTQRLLERLIGEDVALLIAPEPGLGLVKVDAGQVEQILMNLAVNARDAMPQGGTLIIRTANVLIDPATAETHSDVRPGPFSLLMVGDTGCGMDEATLGHIFEPFFTTKEIGKGTGLGLATVYGIVQQSGGFIVVESHLERGTTFSIYLPQVSAETPVRPPAANVPEAANGLETVLLVEDQDGVLGLARLTLQTKGYTVLTARDGLDALEVAQRHEGPIHLLITDVVMPSMSGCELAQRLTFLKPGLKTLYMSGYAPDAILRRGVSEAGMAFLPKPFSPAALAKKVREVLEEWCPARTTLTSPS
jgi:PAS domain S-box-containing protein